MKQKSILDSAGIPQPKETLASAIAPALRRLYDVADRNGNKRAAQELHALARVVVGHFYALCNRRPEIVEPIARKERSIPGWITVDKNMAKRIAEAVEKLNIGKDAGLNYSGKQWSTENPSTRTAKELYDHLTGLRHTWRLLDNKVRSERRAGRRLYKRSFPKGNHQVVYAKVKRLARNLKPLNRQNYKQWFEAAWPLFIAHYGKNFEEHPHFAKFMQSQSFTEGDPHNPGKRRLRQKARVWGRIRDAIKISIRHSFKSLAPKIRQM